MAASGTKACNGSDDSSEDEDLEKFKEAVWDGRGTNKTDEGNNATEPKPTRRLVVSNHQQYSDELQVTPEFRAHVAKKLEHMLDGFISEKAVFCESSSTVEDDDLGFKLFATSIPGQRVDETPCPVKRRPVPSSSESDDEMEMRIREAAVSFRDFLPPPSVAEEVTTKKVKNPTEQNQEGETESPVRKKKKIKAIRREQSVETEEQKGHAEETHSCKTVKKQNQAKTTLAKPVSAKSSLQSWEACGELEEGRTQTKVKRKRKRKHKAFDEGAEG